MSFSYDLTLTASKDIVRFLVADTNINEPLVADEEIAFALSTAGGHVQRTALAVAKQIARQFARQASLATPDLRVEFRDRAEQYRQLVKDLERDLQRSNAMPYAGGISVADMQAAEADTDRVRPAFSIGMHDTPGGAVSTREDC